MTSDLEKEGLSLGRSWMGRELLEGHNWMWVGLLLSGGRCFCPEAAGTVLGWHPGPPSTTAAIPSLAHLSFLISPCHLTPASKSLLQKSPFASSPGSPATEILFGPRVHLTAI